ncbi:glycerate kinase [Halomicroarcula sp. GCM10025817]|uniref:glycerate kinase type-2 family protein n=1 Tax=Haloarcula TaxID=2237 RepID=UPI0023E7AD9D|nr:glycerate kinase [Halomicroarcula sp. SYNS111]
MIRDYDTLARSPAHDCALDCLEAGIEAAQPRTVVAETVQRTGEQLRIDDAVYDLEAYERVVVLGGGKAAAQVARELEAILGDALTGGVVVTDDPEACDRVTVREGDHPVPSQRGVEGAEAVLEQARAADESTLVLAVITGGGSALLPAPAEAVGLEALQSVTDALLSSGATIDEINAVRKHCSRLKGGRLAAAAAPATVATLVFSDVVGDDLSVIASGPTVPDETTFADALAVLDRYDIDAPAVRDYLTAGVDGDVSETPSPGDPAFDRVSTHILADAWTALEAARSTARERGYETMVLSSRLRGEAREAGLAHLAVAEEVVATGNPVEPPAVVLSGGELTVTVRGDGEGGPNQEFALAGAIDLPPGAVLAAVDTDGRDGASDAAGAIVDSETVTDTAAARDALDDNDAGGYLAGRDARIVTGRTGTNVNDLRVLVVD